MARLLTGLLLSAGLVAGAQAADADLVKRGEYLARAADCTACHTAAASRAPGMRTFLPPAKSHPNVVHWAAACIIGAIGR